MQFTRQILILASCAAACAAVASAQFVSGSTGTDGNYSPATSGDFDPIALGLNPAGDNVFNFQNITIPQGVTITLRASKLRNKAVIWLATGTVTITGTLILSGAGGGAINADSPSQLASERVLPEPGPGGYTAGLGSRGGVGPQPGAGPGGGPAGLQSTTGNNCYGGTGSSFSVGYGAKTGPAYGSYQMIPLYGGSGGGGGWDNSTGQLVGGTGGAGGGAIRIAASGQISVTGTIHADGGGFGTATSNSGNAGCPGGSGAGGAIHLVAPTISGNGALTANAANSPGVGVPPNGLIRLSTNTSSFSLNTSPGAIVGPLYLPPANSTLSQPSLSIVSVNGVPVPPEAVGSYLIPDVTIASTTAVTVALAAANIPLTTPVTLRVTAETGADTTITCNALSGTLGSSTTSCSATFPYAVSIAGVRASW